MLKVATFLVKLSGKRTVGDDCILNTANAQMSGVPPGSADNARDRKNDDGLYCVHRSFFISTAQLLYDAPCSLRAMQPAFFRKRERLFIMKEKFFVMTNNPLTAAKLGEKYDMIYEDSSLPEFFESVRKKICGGHILLTHPLSGSVKPGETPYKSVLLKGKPSYGSESADDLALSLKLIESAISACEKFRVRPDRFENNVLSDLQLIDYTLLKSALSSAEAGA